MSGSDFASNIDDSFDAIPIRAAGARHKTDHRRVSAGPGSGIWKVDNGTVLGSAIDDNPEALFNPRPRHTGGYETGHNARRHIPGNVLDRFATANAADHERERKKKQLEDAAKENADRHYEQDLPKASRVKKHESKFYVPKVGDSRGIRIKGRDGRSEIVREPSLPPLHLMKKSDFSTEKKKQAPAAEAARASSPDPSVRSDRSSSTAARAESVVRIVGKDGREVFMPIPTMLGAISTGTSDKIAVHDSSTSRKDDLEKERKRRDAKATKAAKKIRLEMELEEMNKSRSLNGSVISGRSARSSSSVSSRAKSSRTKEVFETATVASSKASAKNGDPMEGRQKKKKKALGQDVERQQKVSQAEPKAKPSRLDKSDEAHQTSDSQKPVNQWSNELQQESQKQAYKPVSRDSSKHDAPSQSRQHSQHSSPKLNKEHIATFSQATWPDHSTVSSQVASKASRSGHVIKPSPLGWETVGNTTVHVSSGSSAAKTKGFRQVGEGAYEPMRSESRSHFINAHSKVGSTSTTSLKYPSPIRSSLSPILEKNWEDALNEVESHINRHGFHDMEIAHELAATPKSPPGTASRAIKREDRSVSQASDHKNTAQHFNRPASVVASPAPDHTLHEAHATREPIQPSPIGGRAVMKYENGSGSGYSYHTDAILRIKDRYNSGHQYRPLSSSTSYGYPAEDGSGTPSPPVLHDFHRPSSASSHQLALPPLVTGFPQASNSNLSSPSLAAEGLLGAIAGTPSTDHSQQVPSGPFPVASVQRSGSVGWQGSNQPAEISPPPWASQSFDQRLSGTTLRPSLSPTVDTASPGFVPVRSGIYPQNDTGFQQPPIQIRSPPPAQGPPYPTNEVPYYSPSPPPQQYASPLQQAYRHQSPQHPRMGQQSAEGPPYPETGYPHHRPSPPGQRHESPQQQAHRYVSPQHPRVGQLSTPPMHRRSPRPHIPSPLQPKPSDDGPTVFAGHGWVSPHPLSAASSGYDRPDPAIRVPAGHPALRGNHGGPGSPATLTYTEYQAVREQRSVIQEQVGSVAPHDQSRADGSGNGKGSAWEEKSEGKVQLKMPWDDGLF